MDVRQITWLKEIVERTKQGAVHERVGVFETSRITIRTHEKNTHMTARRLRLYLVRTDSTVVEAKELITQTLNDASALRERATVVLTIKSGRTVWSWTCMRQSYVNYVQAAHR